MTHKAIEEQLLVPLRRLPVPPLARSKRKGVQLFNAWVEGVHNGLHRNRKIIPAGATLSKGNSMIARRSLFGIIGLVMRAKIFKSAHVDTSD